MYSEAFESVSLMRSVGRRAAFHRRALDVEHAETVQVVGAALGHDVDDAAGRAAEFGRVAARLHLDFFDEVGDDALARGAALEVGRLDAVDDVAVLAGAGAVDREATELRLLVGAGRLRDERREVAAVREQIDLLGADVDLTRVVPDVDERRFRCDRHRFGNAGQRQPELEPLDLAKAHLNVTELLRCKAREVRGDFVESRRQRREPELPGRV